MTLPARHLDYDLPWPLCWTQMQWDMALWWSRYGQRSTMRVRWNEAQLDSQVAAVEFQQATGEIRQQLAQRLGADFVWQFDASMATPGHQLQLTSKSAPKHAT